MKHPDKNTLLFSIVTCLWTLAVTMSFGDNQSQIGPQDITVLSQLFNIRTTEALADVKQVFRFVEVKPTNTARPVVEASLPDQTLLGVPFVGSVRFGANGKVEAVSLRSYHGPSRRDQMDNAMAKELYRVISSYLSQKFGSADEVKLPNVDDSRPVFRLVRSWSDAERVFGVEFYSNEKFGSVYLYVERLKSWEREYGSGESSNKTLRDLKAKAGTLPADPSW